MSGTSESGGRGNGTPDQTAATHTGGMKSWPESDAWGGALCALPQGPCVMTHLGRPQARGGVRRAPGPGSTLQSLGPCAGSPGPRGWSGSCDMTGGQSARAQQGQSGAHVAREAKARERDRRVSACVHLLALDVWHVEGVVGPEGHAAAALGTHTNHLHRHTAHLLLDTTHNHRTHTSPHHSRSSSS